MGLERVAPGAGPSGGGGCVLRFAASAGGPPVRAVRARLVIGADGVASAVKRLQVRGQWGWVVGVGLQGPGVRFRHCVSPMT